MTSSPSTVGANRSPSRRAPGGRRHPPGLGQAQVRLGVVAADPVVHAERGGIGAVHRDPGRLARPRVRLGPGGAVGRGDPRHAGVRVDGHLGPEGRGQPAGPGPDAVRPVGRPARLGAGPDRGRVDRPGVAVRGPGGQLVVRHPVLGRRDRRPDRGRPARRVRLPVDTPGRGVVRPGDGRAVRHPDRPGTRSTT